MINRDDIMEVIQSAFFTSARQGGYPVDVYLNPENGHCWYSPRGELMQPPGAVRLTSFWEAGGRWPYSAEELADLGQDEEEALSDDWDFEIGPLEDEQLTRTQAILGLEIK